MMLLRVVTYNIHSCLGTDGARRPERIARVLRGLRPDVAALQEVERSAVEGAQDTVTAIAEATGLQPHFTTARQEFGNLILARHPFVVLGEGALPRRRGEQRAAQWLRLQRDGEAFDVVNTHLSIHFRERLQQLRALWDDEQSERQGDRYFPTLSVETDRMILCGDFNAGPLSPEYRYLAARLGDAQRFVRFWPSPTYPSRFPLLRLDHIWVGRRWRVHRAEVVQDRLTRLASDHLPLLVELSLEPASEARDGTGTAPVYSQHD